MATLLLFFPLLFSSPFPFIPIRVNSTRRRKDMHRRSHFSLPPSPFLLEVKFAPVPPLWGVYQFGVARAVDPPPCCPVFFSLFPPFFFFFPFFPSQTARPRSREGLRLSFFPSFFFFFPSHKRAWPCRRWALFFLGGVNGFPPSPLLEEKTAYVLHPLLVPPSPPPPSLFPPEGARDPLF